MSWKLNAGLLVDALREYPSQRRSIARIPAGRNIFLTGTHRSGTTWLAKMLAASGIWYVHEPFNPNKGRWPRAFDYRRPNALAADVDRLVSEVTAGGFRAALNMPNAQRAWMPLRLLRPRVSRMLIKDPLACLLTAYLTARFDLQSLILFRHPAGFVSSVDRLGWPRAEFIRDFLADEALMEDHLQRFRPLLERHAGADDQASAAVLCGALNAVLWRFATNGVGRALSFEELCADPVARCQQLFADLGLPYDESVRASHVELCHAQARPPGGYRTHEVRRDSHAMSDSWRGQLTLEQVKAIRDIWEQFDIPLYRSDEDWRL